MGTVSEPAARRSVDLVLEGGGVKGLALLGAVLPLYDAGYRFERLAGTSAGAIVAALVAAYQTAGRDLHELEAVMHSCDYQAFADRDTLEELTGPIGEGIDLLAHQGAHTDDYLYEWMQPLLAEVGVTTFADLRLDDPESSLPSHRQYSLVVHASDLSRRCLVRLPWDYHHYGRPAESQRIVDAVRASMSYPFFFRPVEFTTGSGGTATWVDGGLLSNFPITVFDRTDGTAPRWPTWGVKLSGHPRDTGGRVGGSAPGLALAILHTALGEWNRYELQDEGVGRRTIFVDTSEVDTLDFGLSAEKRRMLFSHGQAAARRFLRHRPGT
jgi:NTE family protein